MPNMLNAEAILRSLIENKVEFVVVGGLAMIAHGSSRVTDSLGIPAAGYGSTGSGSSSGEISFTLRSP